MKQSTNMLSKGDLLSYFAEKNKAQKEKQANRKELMRKQMREVTGGKNIVISNNAAK